MPTYFLNQFWLWFWWMYAVRRASFTTQILSWSGHQKCTCCQVFFVVLQAFVVVFIVCLAVSDILGRRVSLSICINSKRLFGVPGSINTMAQKHLMRDLTLLRQEWKTKNIENAFGFCLRRVLTTLSQNKSNASYELRNLVDENIVDMFLKLPSWTTISWRNDSWQKERGRKESRFGRWLGVWIPLFCLTVCL